MTTSVSLRQRVGVLVSGICLLNALAFVATPPEAKAQQLVLTLSTNVASPVESGKEFTIDLQYACSSTSGGCTNPKILLSVSPALAYVGAIAPSVWSSSFDPGSAAYSASIAGLLPAGSTGSIAVVVKFPSGTTPNGTTATVQASFSADGATPANSGSATFTAVSANRFSISKIRLQEYATVDETAAFKITYEMPWGNDIGGLNLDAATISDMIPEGAVFVSASPELINPPDPNTPGPLTVTWPIDPSDRLVKPNYDFREFYLIVSYSSGTFSAGEEVTNVACLDATAVGEQPSSKCSSASLTLVPPAGTAEFLLGCQMQNRVVDRNGTCYFYPRNTGSIPLENLVLTNRVPAQLDVFKILSGNYQPAASILTVTVEYSLTDPPNWQTLGSAPSNLGTTWTSPADFPPDIEMVRWSYGAAPSGFQSEWNGTGPQFEFTLRSPDRDGSAVNVGDWVTDCADLSWDGYGQPPESTSQHGCSSFEVEAPTPKVNTWRTIGSSGPYQPGSTVNYQLHIWNYGADAFLNPVVTDHLPAGLRYVPGSESVGTNVPGLVLTYIGTSPTEPKWTFPVLGPDAYIAYVHLHYDVTVDPGTPPGQYESCFDVVGTPLPSWYNGDGCAEISVGSAAAIGSTKEVSRDGVTWINASDATTAEVAPGDLFRYRLTLTNTGNVDLQDLVAIDILPYANDNGVLVAEARGSQWTPTFNPNDLPSIPGTTISYDDSVDPCLVDFGMPPSACGWSSSQPTTGTHAMRIASDPGVVLPPLGSLVFEWSMVAPTGTEAGLQACNSYAFTGRRADNGESLLAAEPPSTCVRIRDATRAIYGDFAWVDGNGNGLQDAGEPGLNGVTVQLWNAGPDQTAGGGDDFVALDNDGLPLPATITANNSAAQPGYYQFSNVAPGPYYAQFTPPAGGMAYSFTAPNAGGDTVDSDVDPATGFTVVVTLNAFAADLSWDAGLRDCVDCNDSCLVAENPNQTDSDGDGIGDRCDICPATTPDTMTLNPNQWGWFGPGLDFTQGKAKKGSGGSGGSYTLADTQGCSCTQIVGVLGLGGGHLQKGCSNSAMADWMVYLVSGKRPAAERPAEASLPTEYALDSAYPNPFNPQTTIGFALPEAAHVSLVVYDVMGRRVRVLADGAWPAGRHAAVFDATTLPSGSYLIRLTTPSGRLTRTVQLIK